MPKVIRDGIKFVVMILTGLLTAYLTFAVMHDFLTASFPFAGENAASVTEKGGYDLANNIVSGFAALLGGLGAVSMAYQVINFLARKLEDSRAMDVEITFDRAAPGGIPRWPTQN